MASEAKPNQPWMPVNEYRFEIRFCNLICYSCCHKKLLDYKEKVIICLDKLFSLGVDWKTHGMNLFHYFMHMFSLYVMELEEADAKKRERDACSKNHWFHFIIEWVSIRLMWPPVSFIIVMITMYYKTRPGGWLKTHMIVVVSTLVIARLEHECDLKQWWFRKPTS